MSVQSARSGAQCEAGRLPRAAVGFQLLVCLLLSSISACTFERSDPEADRDGPPLGIALAGPEPQESLADRIDLVLTAVESFRESVATGDLSVSLSQLDSGATLVDPLVGRATETASRGELLLELRRRHAEGLVYEPVETEVVIDGDGSALVLTLLSMLREGESGAWDEEALVFETAYLVRGDEGWRILHLHRSQLPEP